MVCDYHHFSINPSFSCVWIFETCVYSLICATSCFVMIGIYHGARIVRKVPVVVIKFTLNLKHLYAFFHIWKNIYNSFFFLFSSLSYFLYQLIFLYPILFKGIRRIYAVPYFISFLSVCKSFKETMQYS